MTKEQFTQERIALHKTKCPSCRGTGIVDYDGFGGTTIKIECQTCREFERRLDIFCRGFFNPAYVMPRYWNAVYLSKLTPSDQSKLPKERQANLIKLIRENPDQGYAIFGPAQTGKTTVTVGLYAKVLYDELMTADMKPSYRIPVRRLTSKLMLDQHQAWAMRRPDDETPEPEVSRDAIIRAFNQGSKYRLFIEEIDKIKETETRRANLFEILDALNGCMGQLVLTSNLTPEQFAEDFGEDFMHRLRTSAKIINLWQ